MVKQLRIVKESGEFFSIFSLDAQDIEGKNQDSPKIIALDPNHKNFGYGVDTGGEAIEIINLTAVNIKLQKESRLKFGNGDVLAVRLSILEMRTRRKMV